MSRLAQRRTGRTGSERHGAGGGSRPEASVRAGSRLSRARGRQAPSPSYRQSDTADGDGWAPDRHDWLVPLELP